MLNKNWESIKINAAYSGVLCGLFLFPKLKIQLRVEEVEDIKRNTMVQLHIIWKLMENLLE